MPLGTSKFTVKSWRPHAKNTLLGFVSLITPSGLVINDCCLHQKNGSRWFAMPAKSYDKNGTVTWVPMVEFADKEVKERFQSEALLAINDYLASSGDEEPFR